MFDLDYFRKLSQIKNFFIAGCDEVGRGPIAGPVVSCCVCIHVCNFDYVEVVNFLEDLKLKGVTDSKKISERKRKDIIRSFEGLEDYTLNALENKTSKKFVYRPSKNITVLISIQNLSPLEIDQINILNASLECMRRASIEVSTNKCGLILIDGNKKFKSFSDDIELETVVRGDAQSLIIGFASIIAKECRDHLMKNLGLEYPQYNWDSNVGYPTKSHLEALKIYGVTKYHRRTFKGVKELCK